MHLSFSVHGAAVSLLSPVPVQGGNRAVVPTLKSSDVSPSHPRSCSWSSQLQLHIYKTSKSEA